MKLRPNTPHHGHGLMGKPSRKAGLKAGAHVAQRVNTGFKDAKGYQGSAKINVGQNQSGRAPKLAKEAGHYHPFATNSPLRGYEVDASDARRINKEITGASASARRDGFHTGKPSRADTNVRKGADGNAKGSAPPGVGSGKGVRGTPESHRVGQGGPGKLGKGDTFTGQHKPMSEDLSHGWFESLGAK